MTQAEVSSKKLSWDLQHKAVEDVVRAIEQNQALLEIAGIEISDFPSGASAHLGIATAVACEGLIISASIIALLVLKETGVSRETVKAMDKSCLVNHLTLADAVSCSLTQALKKSIKRKLSEVETANLCNQLRKSVMTILTPYFD
jgi:hypothetical protein